MTEDHIKPTDDALEAVESFIDGADDTYVALNQLRASIYELSPVSHNPIDAVYWVPVEKVRPNDYNPNEVADKEMELLHTSIDEDGYTQPIVTVYDEEADMYEIVDGFHRYMTTQMYEDIYERSDGRVPITVIDTEEKNDRRASTVRHNRARGEHSISGKGEVVFGMLDDGASDEEICKALGMEKDELARLKHTTGFSKLFDDTEYQQAWKATQQLQIEKEEGDPDIEIP